jgi:hypothetical protein
MAFITNTESPYRCAIMEDWNWALGYGIGKDVETGKDVFVQHENCSESIKFNSDGTPRVATGYEFTDGVGTLHSGPIGENTKWLERRDRIYYTTKPEYPNIAFNVSIYPHTNVVDIDEEIDEKQRSSFASDSTDDEDDGKPRVREVRTPMKPHDNKNKTPVKKKWVIQKKPAQSPHVGIPPSPDS